MCTACDGGKKRNATVNRTLPRTLSEELVPAKRNWSHYRGKYTEPREGIENEKDAGMAEGSSLPMSMRELSSGACEVRNRKREGEGASPPTNAYGPSIRDLRRGGGGDRRKRRLHWVNQRPNTKTALASSLRRNSAQGKILETTCGQTAAFGAFAVEQSELSSTKRSGGTPNSVNGSKATRDKTAQAAKRGHIAASGSKNLSKKELCPNLTAKPGLWGGGGGANQNAHPIKNSVPPKSHGGAS